MRRLMAGCAAGLFVVAVATTASGQNLNVDLGDNFGSPPSTYAAAGTAGTWNTVNIESVALVDTAGFATTVSLTASADFTGAGPGMSPDVALLGDHIGDCNGVVEWSLAFTGLEHGNYRVLLYAPSHTSIDTGDMLVNGIAVPAILGASELQGGVSHTSLAVSVSGGTLDISGLSSGSGLCIGLAGVQIEDPLVSAPVALNVDLSDISGSPLSNYAAAGRAGTWNTVNIESAALFDTTGAASGVSLTASADLTSSGPGMSPDVALLGDHIGTCSGVIEWSLAFTGLEDGSYRVLLYAPSHTAFDTGDMLVNGIAVPAILGASELQGGGSHAAVVVSVSGGTLDISALPSGSGLCIGLAGVQIEGPLAPPGPVALNVDLGFPGQISPPSSYAAAGTAGTWNPVGIESTVLLHGDGSISLVSLTASADSTGGGPPGMSPDVDLLGDHIGDCNGVIEWSLAFTGLEDGSYRVLLYAPSNTIFDTGDMLVNAIAVPAILGASELQGGVSHTAVVVSVSGGTLDISGSSSGAGLCAGLAGVQVEGPLPKPVPALTVGGRAVLPILLALLSGLSIRRRVSAT